MSKQSRIRRAPHNTENPYFMMHRDTAQDKRVSWEARGILAYLLSKPDDWVLQVRDLQRKGCGRDKVYRILDELKTAGYVQREKYFDEQHRIQWGDYLVHEIPHTEIPYTENPDTKFPDMENTELTNNRTLVSTDDRVLAPKREPKIDPEFEVIKRVFKISAGGWVSNMQGMIFGSKKVKGEWLKCAFEPYATIEEVEAFTPYLKQRMADKNIKDIPTAAVTIQRWFYDFRAVNQRRSNIIKAGDPLLDLSIKHEIVPILMQKREEAS